MKKLIICLMMLCATGAYATGENERVTSMGYVTEELADRQDKFQKLGADTAMTYSGTTDGSVGSRTITGDLGSESNTTNTAIPTVGAVDAKLENKQDELDFAANTVLMNTGTAGAPSAKGIYDDTGSYLDQADSLIDAATFNAALQNAINSELSCAQRKDPNDPTSKCLLFNIFSPVATQSPNLLCTPAKRQNASFDSSTSIMTNSTLVDTRKNIILHVTVVPNLGVNGTRFVNKQFTSNGQIYKTTFTTEADTNYLFLKHNGIQDDFRLWFPVEPSTEYTLVAKALSNDPTTIGGMQLQMMLVPGNYDGNEIIPCGQNIYVPQNQ